MAVQKSKKTRSKRGMRRAHDAISGPTLSEESSSGEIHLRHQLSSNGFYRGKQIIEPKQKNKAEEEESES